MIYTTITAANGLYSSNLGPPIPSSSTTDWGVGNCYQQANQYIQNMEVEFKLFIGNFEFTAVMEKIFWNGLNKAQYMQVVMAQ